ncbi:MAG: PspA/IM30 family protein [Pseudomonadota bacterium]
MGMFKRFTTTVSASVDKAVNRIENHDAIVDAALKDAQRASATFRVRLERVRRDGRALTKRRDDAAAAAEKWATRARQVAEDDEARALDCLKRRRDCTAQIEALDVSIDEHKTLEAKLDAQTREIEERIRAISRQRNLMRSRASVTEAMDAMARVESQNDLDDTFERWDIQLSESEIRSDAAALPDRLEREFACDEKHADLKAELADLMRRDGETQ